MIVQAIRSLLFYVLYLGQTVVLAIIVGTDAIIRGRTGFGWAVARYWGNANLFFLRWVVGIKTDVQGTENIPDGPCILAAKHMSDWDIFAILPHTRRPAFIAKKELTDIPFFGWAARSFDTIRIDRSKGSDAIPSMMADARAAIERGCRIVIFPEGTRKAPLAPHDYRYGIVRMYEALGVPVVPIALNSGLYWGRHSLVLWPGTARARFLPPIMPGLPAEDFHRELAAGIEGETNRLLLEAYEQGLSRPIPPELREKLEALRCGSPPLPGETTTS
ncbi:MAG: lysophospholipid acyltransferase family protein [Devosia sp.]|nr:lysophospholipid acyltransferase family protein [Devosia sp.]